MRRSTNKERIPISKNTFVKAQCDTMIQSVKAFEQACQLAALEDDGVISKEEARTLKRIRAAASAFRKVLERV